ncbi:YcxB family protein [Anaeromicrobium sediminis]|uniref:YcxB-like C-terminal domain-containing protein n=1 Tax=Anaeromicrobium sediminis TaxID=1478221 RepID=A0A267MNG6_9FIRM|nr:YcxB family protein [Anaeromicrobium sediminis]PAB61076.1 hypothetical protein CCE28_01215 [Anaeromicrobium sediminis]
MKITYDTTKEDYWNFNKYVKYNNFRTKMTIILAIILVPITIYISLGAITNSKIYSLVCAVISFGIIYYIMVHGTRKRAFKFAEDEGGILGKHTIEVSEEGITEKTYYCSRFHIWNSVKNIEMTEEYIFIFLSEIQAYPIPKRAFKTENEAVKFYNFLIRHFQEKNNID